MVRSEILDGKMPEFRLANGTDAHLFTGIPDAFDDGSYGFHMSPDQYIFHVGRFFELDETTGTLKFRGDKPDVLGYKYEPAQGKHPLVIEAGDGEAGAVGRISFVQLILATCYGMHQPEGFKPDIICSKKSPSAKWKVIKPNLNMMSREFVWPKSYYPHNLASNSPRLTYVFG